MNIILSAPFLGITSNSSGFFFFNQLQSVSKKKKVEESLIKYLLIEMTPEELPVLTNVMLASREYLERSGTTVVSFLLFVCFFFFL